MVIVKSYTSIEQSKQLLKILPDESADMRFIAHSELVNIHEPFYNYKKIDKDDIPCWSLGALLKALPFHIISNNKRYGFDMVKGFNKDGETYMIRYNIFNTDICLYKTEYYNNPVDACVEMLMKLHELNLL